MLIHPSVIIERETNIHPSVKIGAYSIIREGVILGEGCEIGSHVEVAPYSTLGNYNKIFKGAYLGGTPQDISYNHDINNKSLLHIGHHNTIREYVVIHHGTKRATVIGDNNYFMAHSHVAHDCILGNDIKMANYSGLGGWVEVNDHVFISGHSLIHQYVRIGKGAMIGGISRVNQDIPPFSLIANEYARIYGINQVVLNRLGMDSQKKVLLKRIFKDLFIYNLSENKILDNLQIYLNNPEFIPVKEEIEIYIEFIKSSKRGIITKKSLNNDNTN